MPNGEELTVRRTMQFMRRVLPCEEHRQSMTLHKRCFKADDAVQAFRVAFPQEIVSVEAAVAFGTMLQQAKILTHVSDPQKPFCSGRSLYRLQCYQNPEILNSARVCDEAIDGDVMDLLSEVNSLLVEVERTASDAKSGLIDYSMAYKSPYFSMFEDSLCRFQQLNLKELDEITRVAVGINIYNIMTKFAFMKVGVPQNKSSRASFTSEVKLNIGGDILSFDELEYGVLVGNRRGVFGSKDPRLRLAVGGIDPRVHFVLHRTPLTPHNMPLIYPSTLHYDLQRETKKYLAIHSNLMIDSGNRVIHVNELFRLHRHDIGKGDTESLTSFLERNLEGGKKLAMQSLIQGGKPPTLEYMDLDWGSGAGTAHAFRMSSLKVNKGIL